MILKYKEETTLFPDNNIELNTLFDKLQIILVKEKKKKNHLSYKP